MSTPQNLVELANQGNPKAIEILMNRHLQPKGITARALIKDSYLTLIVESKEKIEKDKITDFLRNGIAKLQITGISKLVICGRFAGQSSFLWREPFDLAPSEPKLLNTKPQTITRTDRNDIQQKNNKQSKFDTLKILDDLKKTLLNFIQTRNGERFSIALGTFLITSVLWFGIGSLYANKAKSKTDSQHFTFIPFGVNNYSIQGSLKLTDSNIGGTASDCFGTGGYSDIEAAMPVTVRDGQGKILATGRTSSGSYPVGTQVWSSECTFTFQVDNVPKSDFYTIEVGRRGGLNYSFEEIQKQNWKVSLSLGS